MLYQAFTKTFVVILQYTYLQRSLVVSVSDRFWIIFCMLWIIN